MLLVGALPPSRLIEGGEGSSGNGGRTELEEEMRGDSMSHRPEEEGC